ncbi:MULTISPECIES: hypothetical protein [unclassified Psychrobacillus]|uniref:hypothetical protein n=1 Tax=unclassified Psychrobacillus TaxID=2636677 RepID=UPI0030FA20EF
MKWLVDKADTSNMTIRFKSRRKKTEGIAYTVILSKSLKEYIQEEKVTGIRFGYDTDKGQTKLVIGFNKEGQGASLLNNKKEIRSWFEVTEYIEQYMEEGIEVNLLVDYQITLRKNGTLLLELEKKE